MVDVAKIDVWQCKDIVGTPEDREMLYTKFFRVGMVSTTPPDSSSRYSCIFLFAGVNKYTERMGKRLRWLNELETTLGQGTEDLQWRYYKFARKGVEKSGIRWAKLDAAHYFHRRELSREEFADEYLRAKANLEAAQQDGSLIKKTAPGDVPRWNLTDSRYMWVMLVAEWIAFTAPGRAAACIVAGTLNPRRNNSEALNKLKVFSPGMVLGGTLSSVLNHFEKHESQGRAKTHPATASVRKRTRAPQTPSVSSYESDNDCTDSDTEGYVPGFGVDTESLRDLYSRGKRPDAELKALQAQNDLRENVEDYIAGCDRQILEMENLINLHKIELEVHELNMKRLEENLEWEKQRYERMRKNLEYAEKRLGFEQKLKEMYQRNFFKQPRRHSPSPGDSV